MEKNNINCSPEFVICLVKCILTKVIKIKIKRKRGKKMAKEIMMQPVDWWKIVGISPYEKDGNTSYTLHLIGYFSDFDSNNGARGLKVETEWTRIDCGFLNIGDVVELRYSKGFKGMATLCDVVVHKEAKRLPFGCPEVYVESQDIPDQPAEKGKN